MKQNLVVALALAAGATQVSLYGVPARFIAKPAKNVGFVKPLAASFAAQSVKLGSSLFAGVRQHPVLAALGLTAVVVGCEAYRPWDLVRTKLKLMKAERAHKQIQAKLKKELDEAGEQYNTDNMKNLKAIRASNPKDAVGTTRQHAATRVGNAEAAVTAADEALEKFKKTVSPAVVSARAAYTNVAKGSYVRKGLSKVRIASANVCDLVVDTTAAGWAKVKAVPGKVQGWFAGWTSKAPAKKTAPAASSSSSAGTL